jgi:hypothetical protein
MMGCLALQGKSRATIERGGKSGLRPHCNDDGKAGVVAIGRQAPQLTVTVFGASFIGRARGASRSTTVGRALAAA